jgi:hypothetical protein
MAEGPETAGAWPLCHGEDPQDADLLVSPDDTSTGPMILVDFDRERRFDQGIRLLSGCTLECGTGEPAARMYMIWR